MDISPFTIEYNFNESVRKAEIRPCCREDNVVDYAVWIKNKLAFTVTKEMLTGRWVVALKNADETIDDAEVQEIGKAIQRKYSNTVINEGR
jgi:hypothetical protein